MKLWIQDDIEIDTDQNRLPIQVIYDYLGTTYWAANRTFEVVETSIRHSLCFGMYQQNELIGFARIVTDYSIFAYLCDVFILPLQQGNGYGKILMKTVHEHPELQNLRRWMLATKDAHGLYLKNGYTEIVNPSRWMEKFNVDL
jgi:GNAT superfamily N-acetyltransferase